MQAYIKHLAIALILISIAASFYASSIGFGYKPAIKISAIQPVGNKSVTMGDTLQFQTPARDFDGWRVLPIKSEYEYNQGIVGGEAMQLPHSITRSESNPDYVYWAHDNSGPWVSTNGGDSWKKCLNKGLYQSNGDSIKVDPVNPKIVFAVLTHLWYFQDTEFSGLYRSIDGCDNWELVLPLDWSLDWDLHRYIKDLIAYDPSTKEATGTRDWYVVFPSNGVSDGLYKSVDYGSTWSKIASTSIDKFYQIAVDNGKVYLGSDEGLLLYTPATGALNPLGNLPTGVAVTSVFVHPSDSNTILVTVYNDGLYKSTNSGANFVELEDFAVQAGFYNPGYPDTIYLVGIWKGTSTTVTHDGGITWHKNEDCHNIPESIYSTRIYGPPAGVVSNAKNPDEAVAFGNSNIYKTINGGVTFTESATLFTGYSVVLQSSFAFDQFEPDRFALGLADVGYVITNNRGNWFYRNFTTSTGDQITDWGYRAYTDPNPPYIPYRWVIYVPGIDFKPIDGSEAIAATVGYSPVSRGRTRRMYLANESAGWALETSFIPSDPNPPYPQDLFLQYHRTDSNVVYTTHSKSVDGGVSYQPIDFSPYTEYGPPFIQGQCLSHPDVIYATYQYHQQILRSDDRGATWISLTYPGWKFNKLSSVATFAVDPIDLNLVYSVYADGDIASYNVTSDTWQSLGLLSQVDRPETMYSFVSSISIDPNYNNIIYAVVTGSGISRLWRSTDAGTTWQDISYNLPRAGGYTIGISPHTGELFAGGLGGTWVFLPPEEFTYPSSSLVYYSGNAYSMPSCSDGLQNGDETGIDSGGSCAACSDGQTRQCGITDVGECSYGTQTCSDGSWSNCIGAVEPTTEICTGSLDEDCDGLTDANDPDCIQCVDTQALLNYISQWKQGQTTMQTLMQRIAQWKTGC